MEDDVTDMIRQCEALTNRAIDMHNTVVGHHERYDVLALRCAISDLRRAGLFLAEFLGDSSALRDDDAC